MTFAGTKYQYQRRLGGGGMAEVYLASTVGAEGFSRPIAIKRVLPSYSEDPGFAAMFVNEARISALLRHTNIVQVLDFDRDPEGRLYLVMDLVEGKDLANVLAVGALPLPVVVHVIREALTGLAHAHEMTSSTGKPLGIVHRDVSPHNVLVSWDGGVKVADFGIAKAMAASGAVASGTIKGKPLYMAPEQVTMPDRIDHRADLFAVGVVLYEMLTGQRVYRGSTHQEVLTDVLQVANGWRRLVAPEVSRPDVPRDISDVAMRLLAVDREHRFAHARDAIDALSATASASSQGAELLALALAERFPAESPPRIRRRAGVPSISTGPTGGAWIVHSTLPSTAEAPLAAGTPTSSVVDAEVARAMAVNTRTGAASHAARRRRARVAVAGVITLTLALAAVVIASTRGHRGGAHGRADAATTVPAPASVPDASPVAVPTTDAATTVPPDAARVDARPSRRPSSHPPRGGSESTIHDVPIQDDP